MLPYQIIAGGHFTSDTTLSKEIYLSDRPDFFWMRNRTAWGNDAAVTAVDSWWRRGMAQGAAQTTDQAVTTGAQSTNVITVNGYTFIDTANPPTFAPLAATAITGNAGTFIVSMANTGNIVVGDRVRLYGTTGELQIAGYTFQVTAVTANTSITLGYMASSGITFAAAATAGQVIKYYPSRFYPRWNYIANITQAAQAVVFFTGKNDFTPGEIVGFRVPSAFGMDEINNKDVRILSVTNSATVSSITLDLDTTGFTAFSFPTSAVAAAGISPAVVVPSSSGVVPFNGSATTPQEPPGTNLQDSFDNRNKFLMQLGSNVITASANVYDWMACRYDVFVSE